MRHKNLKSAWPYNPNAYEREEFLNNYHENLKIDSHGTLLGRLSCCNAYEIDHEKICKRCCKQIYVVLSPYRVDNDDYVTWKVGFVTANRYTHIVTLACPLCNNPITEKDRICKAGVNCRGALCDVELRKNDDVWEIHRRIRQIRHGYTDLDPAVQIISENTLRQHLPKPRLEPTDRPTQQPEPLIQTPKTEIIPPAEVALRKIPNDADLQFIRDKITFKADGIIPRRNVYDKYTDWYHRHYPNSPTLNDRGFYKLIRTHLIDLNEAQKRMNGKLLRCFIGLDITD